MNVIITCQDGYFLSQLLLSNGYEVHDILSPKSPMTQDTIDLLHDNVRGQILIHYGDIADGYFLSTFLKGRNPRNFIIWLHRVQWATPARILYPHVTQTSGAR